MIMFRALFTAVLAVVAALGVTAWPVSAQQADRGQYWQVGRLTWVSVSYLEKHPEVLPDRPTVIGGRLELVGAPGFAEAKEALKCRELTCIHVWGDSIFVDKSALYYYSPPEGCMDNSWQWFPAGASRVQGMHHTACPRPNTAGETAGFYYDELGPTGTMQDGKLMCGSWIGGKGVACADIKR
ncbi:hypothetical protein ACFYTQ_13495 [Nocardia sp. NPDC004068]|uniref:hypothetical protein n=1 Tax=Nocardia sp. NPDC004068 TaxID=3364303 RepID=UPI0036A37701